MRTVYDGIQMSRITLDRYKVDTFKELVTFVVIHISGPGIMSFVALYENTLTLLPWGMWAGSSEENDASSTCCRVRVEFPFCRFVVS